MRSGIQSCFLIILSLFLSPVHGQVKSDTTRLLFAYFKGNGDGLHLAHSTNGYQWEALKGDSSFLTPTAGKDKLMRDPCIVQGPDGIFHMVWTVSWNEKGIGYANSKDLIHWSEQQYLPLMQHEEGARNCWAPEIMYDASSGEFMLYWATTITGKFTETQSSKENAYNHRMYYVTTKDFKSFSKAALLYDKGFNVIDASIIRHKKEYVMFLKDETIEPPQKNIRIATSKKMTGAYSKPGGPITGAYWAEGPTCIQLKGTWIVYFDKYRDHKMGAVQSADLKTWIDVSDQIKFPSGVRHGTVFQVPDKIYQQLILK